jgi:hypothetical protein
METRNRKPMRPNPIALSQNPQLLAIIERSRARQTREGGISSADMRRQFTDPTPQE